MLVLVLLFVCLSLVTTIAAHSLLAHKLVVSVLRSSFIFIYILVATSHYLFLVIVNLLNVFFSVVAWLFLLMLIVALIMLILVSQFSFC